MDGNFGRLSSADILRRMSDKFGKLIERTDAEISEWRQPHDRATAARAAMLELYRVTIVAVGEARLRGSLMEIAEVQPDASDKVRVKFMGRTAEFERDSNQNIIIRNGGAPETFDPTAIGSVTAWAEGVASSFIVYLAKGK